MTAYSVAKHLGGKRILKREVHTEFDLVDAIERGLPVGAVGAVIESGLLSASEIHDLIIPRRTLAHRKDKGHSLTPDQSDRLARVVRVVGRAEEALASADKAARWLRKPNRALQGKRPLDLLDSDVGCRLVEQVLGRVEHGLTS